MSDYSIIKDTRETVLGQSVKSYLDQGWLCAGGVQIIPGNMTGEKTYYIQAMYRLPSPPEENGDPKSSWFLRLPGPRGKAGR